MKRRAPSSKRAAAAAVHLREYQPDDFETLWEIDQLCYEPLIAYSRPTLRHFLNARGADCIVAETGTKSRKTITGFCITARRGDEAYVVTIDVLAEFRKQGVGSTLLREAERRLASHSVKTVTLDTSIENSPAISFWQKHGYRKLGIRKGYYPDGVDAFAMAKALA